MRVDSVTSLVDAVAQYRLLEPAQLDELKKKLQVRFAEPRDLARELLQRGWLTAYQVNQLFQGRTAELVLGSYVLLERLGEGGMGQVFKARHQKLARTVALKIIRQDRLTNAEALHRFRREILLAAQLSHPNVVHSYDADQIGDRHLIVMEYVDGIDLSRLVRQRGPVPIRDACDHVRQAALGLQHAHEHSLVHRDIKPSNLLLTKAQGSQSAGLGVVKILDLGLARVLGDDSTSMVTQDGSLVGTPDFIAPEQARSAHSADIRSDIYSLGCTLFFLLTGQPPFTGGSMTEKLLKHHWDAPPAVEGMRPDVPPIVSAIIRKLMAKRPEDRLQTPRDVADVLSRVLEPGGFEAPIPAELIVAPSDPETMLPAAIPVAMPAPGELILPQAMMATPTHGEATEVSLTALPVAERFTHRRRWPWVAGVLGAAFLAVLALSLKSPSRPKATQPTTRAPVPPPEVVASPLDKLSKDRIAAADRVPMQPRELVAVLGEHRGRHFGPVRSVAFSPDGQTLASAGEDGCVRLWQPATLQLRNTLKGGTAGLLSLAYSPDGSLLAAGDWDGNIRLWEGNNPLPREAIVLDNSSAVWAIAFHSASRLLAAALDDKTVQIWRLVPKDGPRKGPKLEGHQEPVGCVAFSGDGQLFASGSDDHTIRLYDFAGFSTKLRGVLQGHMETVTALAFAPDGQTLASASDDKTICFWDVTRTTPAMRGKPFEVGSEITSLTYIDHQTLACGRADATIAIYDLRGNRPKQRTRLADTTRVRALAFSAQRDALAAGSDGGMVRIWDWNDGQTRERVLPRGHTGQVHALAFTPDGQTLATGSRDTTVRLWQLDGSEPKERAILEGQGAGITSVGYSADGKRLAAASHFDGLLRLWDLPATVPRVWPMAKGEEALGGSVAFVDRNTLATAGQDAPKEGIVRLWDFSGTEPRGLRPMSSHTGMVRSLAVSSDGRLLASAGGTDATVHVWDRASQRAMHKFYGVKDGFVDTPAFSPNGKLLVYSSADVFNVRAAKADVLIRRWDLSASPPRELGPLPGHTAAVQGVSFAPDGRSLATGDEEGRLILWEPDTGKNLHDWRFPGGITSVRFAPDGRHLAVGNSNGTVYILRLKAAPTARPTTGKQ